MKHQRHVFVVKLMVGLRQPSRLEMLSFVFPDKEQTDDIIPENVVGLLVMPEPTSAGKTSRTSSI